MQLAEIIVPAVLHRAQQFGIRRDTAMLTIVFTDIANSTALRETIGERQYERYREAHDQRVEDLVTRGQDGIVVKGLGDGQLLAFSEPSTAVERVCELQTDLQSDSFFKLRIGLDVGQVSVKRKLSPDVFGRHVNRAARIQALADPGHILTSAPVYDASENWLRDQPINWKHLGEASLKGFSSPTSIMEVYDRERWSPQQVLPISSVIDYENLPASVHSEVANYVDKELPTESPQGLRVLYKRELKHERAKLALLQPLEIVPGDKPYEQLGLEIATLAARFAIKFGRPFTVYWIDDFPSNNRRLVDGLTSHGVIVESFRHDPELQRAIVIDVPDLLITDLGRYSIPDAGLRTLKRLTAEEFGPPRIVFSTGKAIGRFAEECYKAGASLVTSGGLSLYSGVKQVLFGAIS